jgi:hypothetical protein
MKVKGKYNFKIMPQQNGTDLVTNTHATRHVNGGDDAIKLDDLASPDDNTDLDSTVSQHGLLPKLGGGSTNFLRADGTWSAPPGAGGGEANTASNVGTGGIGVFKQKTGVDLEFKKINAGSNAITITDDVGNNEVDVDVVPANIKLDDLGTPDDNTDLDATTSLHGLLPKLGGGTTNFLRADGTWSAPAGGGLPVVDFKEQTTIQSTTSLTPVLVPGMTTTPAAGTYAVWFDGTCYQGAKTNKTRCCLSNDGTEIISSRSDGSSGGINFRMDFTCSARITVNGSQAIEGRMAAPDGNTTYIETCNMLIMKVDTP